MVDNIIKPIIDPGGGGAGVSSFTGDIQEKAVNYQILVTDGYVAMTGTVNATLPAIASATEGVWIDCVSGTTTVLGDASIEAPTILTPGMKGYFVPLAASWRQG